MATKKLIRDVLTRRLRLESPQFVLEKAGTRVSGSIISDSFRGESDIERQRRIWDALEDEFGAEAVHAVGTLLAYTPAEWNFDAVADEPAAVRPRRT